MRRSHQNDDGRQRTAHAQNSSALHSKNSHCVASTRIHVKPDHVYQLGDQHRVGDLDRAGCRRAGHLAQAHRQRLAIVGARSMRPVDRPPLSPSWQRRGKQSCRFAARPAAGCRCCSCETPGRPDSSRRVGSVRPARSSAYRPAGALERNGRLAGQLLGAFTKSVTTP